MKGFWGIMEIPFLKVANPTSEVDMLSIKMEDSRSHYTSQKRACKREDLPAPVRPTTPNFIPDYTLNSTSFRTALKSALYRRVTELK